MLPPGALAAVADRAAPAGRRRPDHGGPGGLQRHDLTADALRLTRMLHRLLPGDGEVAGLLALILLTEAESRVGALRAG